MNTLAHSYSGRSATLGGSIRNPAAECIRISLELLNAIKTGQNVNIQQFAYLIQSAGQTYARSYLFAHKLTNAYDIPTEIHALPQKVLSAGLMDWVLEVEDPIQEIQPNKDVKPDAEEIDSKTSGIRGLVTNLLRRLKGHKMP